MNALVKESGHWYDKDGNPAYDQPHQSKPGQTRPTTLRDAKKLGLVPSVTTILKMAAQPALEKWKLNQLMMAALTLPAVKGESIGDYEARLWEDANAQSEAAKIRGAEIHGFIESHFQGGTVDAPRAIPFIDAVEEALYDAFGDQEWSAEKAFASDLGFGGKIDLHSPHVIIDYKTKDNNKIVKKPMSYIENKMQLSAYRKGLGIPDAVIANLYIGRDLQEDGSVLVKLEIHDGDWWPEFECLLKYWKLVKNHGQNSLLKREEKTGL